jgi:hypothetical protein
VQKTTVELKSTPAALSNPSFYAAYSALFEDPWSSKHERCKIDDPDGPIQNQPFSNANPKCLDVLLPDTQLYVAPGIYSSDFSTPLPEVVDKCIQSSSNNARQALYNVSAKRALVFMLKLL